MSELTAPPPWTVGPITRTEIVRYQGASGDFNPIHHDEPFATGAGYPAPLGIGMLHAGLMNTWAVKWLGPANVRRTRVRWKAPVFPGDVLTFSGSVERQLTSDSGEARVEISLVCAKADGTIAATGLMEFARPG
ncbi:MAG: acyl dehydratase [Myxococcota bacterium]|jgi:acyl dehydratase